ncbi:MULTISPECIES: alpha/beta hydrolase-fold protein [Asticcacaulis]|uniref:alpha/beta hydrolase n=1 Tax=Asticcacaulis TaxID=76890 RepID=UPI002854AA30|nr:alpha/beta hydrolase-fold protein [Asticcacaulis sp. BE141]MBP2157873.1 enterochelin esterase family protein [Asticcacaulis solisilvae]MDR6798918.1 enterochelin esterase family protein [Asticcacaulis sp. BE141]
MNAGDDYHKGMLAPIATFRLTCAAALFALCMAVPVMAQERKTGDYPLTADSLVQADIKHGRLEGPFEFHSKLIPDTVRRYWIYVPAGYDAKTPPNLLVFQDGQRATNPNGSLRVQNVLDNLIAKGEIPKTLGVFVTPGNTSATYPDNLGMSNPNHRAEEYDALSDTYARMLTEELLPHVAKSYAFTSDPKRRVIGGTSSGAIASFTTAWNHPEAFGNVISIIGSYTSIGYKPATATTPFVPGGDIYPGVIRKSKIRPLRIFIQDGSNDLDNEHGNWFLANQQMVKSIEWANANADKWDLGPHRYDLKYVWGDGAHSDQHGGALLPDILRWIWRDQK